MYLKMLFIEGFISIYPGLKRRAFDFENVGNCRSGHALARCIIHFPIDIPGPSTLLKRSNPLTYRSISQMNALSTIRQWTNDQNRYSDLNISKMNRFSGKLGEIFFRQFCAQQLSLRRLYRNFYPVPRFS